jgi:hypothetical protein
MALSIKNAETETLIRRLARQEGTTMVQAIKVAVKHRLQKSVRFAPDDLAQRMEAIRNIQERFSAGRNDCNLSDDEIIGYDESGAPN